MEKPELNQNNSLLENFRDSTPDIIKNNAPRVVAGLKILGSVSALFSKNRFFSIAGAGFITAQSIVLMFGRKKTEEEKERLREEESANSDHNQGGLSHYFSKVLNPRKYPLESGMSIGMLASGFWAASGIFDKSGFSSGRLLGGALSLGSDANIVFTKEHIGEPETNPYEKGSINYYLTEMKHRPVLLSSLLNVGSDVASIMGGFHEYRHGKEINTLLTGTCLLSANLFQALFVNKNDYNIEKKHTANLKESTDENDRSMTNTVRLPNSDRSWEKRIQQPSDTPQAYLA